jgi:hypothetical protein
MHKVSIVGEVYAFYAEPEGASHREALDPLMIISSLFITIE